jgi:acetyl coenzyme A synthetase (ADP forming)-like protein
VPDHATRARAPYPAHREADVVLRDGSTVHVRPVRRDDREVLKRFLERLSPDSRSLRFFSLGVNLDGAAEWAADVDYELRFGLVALGGTRQAVVGHATWSRADPDDDRAEVAFEVADAYQGNGLGTILLAHLAEAAEERGVSVFEAEVLPHNHRMAEVFRESGFAVRTRSGPDVLKIEFPTEMSEGAMERFEERDRTAAAAAVAKFLRPESVAVIGASRERGTVGGEIFHNLIATAFNGPVFPVNPHSRVVQSVPAFASVRDILADIELAVVAVPAAAVAEVARQCAAKGVDALLVISAGFAETGDEGRARQEELVGICREAGMRLIGPNCLGVLNTSPDVQLDAMFGPLFPPHGNVAFLSQSGALGLAVVDYAQELGLGLSSFVSVGNKADISGNDLIQYWESDPDTQVMLLYLESFGNPRKFARIAPRVARQKPIVAVKSGRSAAGARATSSHTGALISASDVTVDSLFRQAGVIRTDTLAELFDVARLLANQPLPRGRRVAIVTNAGGPGILCADTCEARGLEVPELPAAVREELAAFLPAEASLANPLDMIATAPAAHYRQALEVLARHDCADAIVAIFIPPLATRSEDVARAIRAAVDEFEHPLPVVSVFMTSEGKPPGLSSEHGAIPAFAFPEDAARALARAVDYGTWRDSPPGRIPRFEDARLEEAAAVIASALGRRSEWLAPDEVERLLGCYGLAVVQSATAADPDGAARAAGELGGPVALKAVAPTIVHKTELGAVAVDLPDAEAVRDAAEQMTARLTAAGHAPTGFVVQRMAPPGVEMLVGVAHDRHFGPVIACGAGGVAAEVMKDVAVRITPLSDRDAHTMVTSLRSYPLLEGFRGAPPADVAALEEVLLRVGAMVEAHPEVAEMDCNPVVVSPSGALIVDARVRVEAVAPSGPSPTV